MPESVSSRSKRLVKNTVLLYVRMIFTMAVGLFTSRVILDVLGVQDYGVYNVVAGVVTMFSFFTSSLGVAISRFLTFELGRGDKDKLSKIFSTSVNIQLCMSLFIILLAETIGVWFLNTHLNIPSDRMGAANWVLQCAMLGFVFNLISVPYNAAIIAHERMGVFAYISILEVTLKLVIVYMLYISPFDKLITYSILFATVGLIIRIVYGLYCKKAFEECSYRFVLDKSMLKQMSGFAGWNMLGNGAVLFNNQGVNIVTNLYFGVTVNAARGIANQVEGIIRQFVNNFTTALNPQITKSYAAGDLDYLHNLVCKGSKYCYFLMLIFAVPFMYESDTILNLWLKEVPEHTSLFLKLTIWDNMIDVLGVPPAYACWATGNVKRYYIWIGSICSTVFFISWLLFELGFPAYTSYVVFMIVYLIMVITKLYIIKDLIGMRPSQFYRQTFMRIIPATIVSHAVCYIPYSMMDHSFLRLVVICVLSTATLSLLIYYTGLEKPEREVVRNKAMSFVKRKMNK